MATTKDRLIELIEAYAVAKTTSNSILQSLSANALKIALEELDGSPGAPSSDTAGEGFVTPEPTPAPRGRTGRRSD